MADPRAVSVLIPAFNEGEAIAAVVTALAAAAPWHEILVVDDGSADATSEQARSAGATVIRHPYNKGNGAAVKTGIRTASAEFVLIIDGDGQHKPEDAVRLVSRHACGLPVACSSIQQPSGCLRNVPSDCCPE